VRAFYGDHRITVEGPDGRRVEAAAKLRRAQGTVSCVATLP
jgi:hypothetical protein